MNVDAGWRDTQADDRERRAGVLDHLADDLENAADMLDADGNTDGARKLRSLGGWVRSERNSYGQEAAQLRAQALDVSEPVDAQPPSAEKPPGATRLETGVTGVAGAEGQIAARAPGGDVRLVQRAAVAVCAEVRDMEGLERDRVLAPFTLADAAGADVQLLPQRPRRPWPIGHQHSCISTGLPRTGSWRGLGASITQRNRDLIARPVRPARGRVQSDGPTGRTRQRLGLDHVRAPRSHVAAGRRP